MRKLIRLKMKDNEIVKFLEETWMELNESKFESSLKKCPKFSITSKELFLAAYYFEVSPKNNIVGTKIIISKKLFFKSKKKVFLDAFLHEMAHQYCVEVLGFKEEEHGPIWKMICRAVGAVPSDKCLWVIK